MNERIKELFEKSLIREMVKDHAGNPMLAIKQNPEKFAELLIQECDQLNRSHSHELTGVVIDTEQGDGFDHVCLGTVKRVESWLANDSMKKHFGIVP